MVSSRHSTGASPSGGAVARAVRVDLAARNRPEKIGALHQPRRKTLVAQGSPSELVLRPLRRAQPLARLQGRRVLDMRHSEPPAPAGVERTHEHRLRRLREPLGGILAAAPGRLANAQEAGDPLALRRAAQDAADPGLCHGRIGYTAGNALFSTFFVTW